MRFSSRALESLDSSEQLDDPAHYAPVPLWLIAAAMTPLIAGAIAWAALGAAV